MTIANATELTILDAIFNNVALQIAQPYLKLHIGDPGEDGTGSPAVETTRKALSVGPASAGAVTSDADVVWTNVAASETYSHISIWTTVGPAGGVCLWVGQLAVSKVMIAGDTFTIASGSLVVSLD
jgi:hypothetical protein